MFTRVMSSSLIVGALVLGVAGCQPPHDPAPNPGLADPVPPPYNDPDIAVVDEDLQQWIRFQPATIVRSESRPLRVEVPVRNIADDQYIVQYRFQFFDASGSLLEPEMHWQRAVLEPRVMDVLRASALDQSARTWKLQVRWAR